MGISREHEIGEPGGNGDGSPDDGKRREEKSVATTLPMPSPHLRAIRSIAYNSMYIRQAVRRDIGRYNSTHNPQKQRGRPCSAIGVRKECARR